MTGTDLLTEYLVALRRTSLADLRPLIDAGVGGAGLAVAPARARISVSRDGLFEPDPDSDAVAFIVPTRVGNTVSPEVSDPIETVRDGEIVDLLAFSPAFPNRWALRTGAASWLG